MKINRYPVLVRYTMDDARRDAASADPADIRGTNWLYGEMARAILAGDDATAERFAARIQRADDARARQRAEAIGDR